MTEIAGKQVTCTAKLLTPYPSFTEAVWQVLRTNLSIPAPLGKRVWCSTRLEGLTDMSGTSFQPGGAAWSGTSLDPEGGVTVLAQHCIQVNDCLLAGLISLSTGERSCGCLGLAQRWTWVRFMSRSGPYGAWKPTSQQVSQSKEKKINVISSRVWKLWPAFVIFTNHQPSRTVACLI